MNILSQNNYQNELLQKQRESFIASLSHDLKNPTIAQIRAMELLLKGKFGKISSKQKEIIEMVLDSCKYMNAMLGNVLINYRSEKGRIPLNIEKVFISDIAAECIDEMVYLAKEKGVNVIGKFDDKVAPANEKGVYGDAVQLRRVIINLLSNGIKYAYPHTDMFVSVYDEEKYTCFKFQNRSPYITPEKQEKIFAKYITFGMTNNLSGTGLGLYASKKIIEAHNGIMFLESSKNETNTFGFKIPFDKKFKDAKCYVIFD